MTNYPIHTLETAPDKSRPVLEKVRQNYGLIPNLMGTMAESPSALEAYVAMAGFFQNSSFSPLEVQVVAIATAVENSCHYCVAAHSAITKMRGLDQDVISAVRDQRAIADPRLEALRIFTTKIVRERGFISAPDRDAFIAAGFTRAQVLEVVQGVAFKIMSNYINHIVQTPVDPAFSASAWIPRTQVAE